jgi:Spy/CpxP family protein refolding chaperone
MRRRALAIVAIAALGAGAPYSARAADPRYPDWPCNQLKVPEISVAAVWAGPPIDDVRETWQNDPQIRDLVDRLAARRTPMEEAEKSIAQFIVGAAAKEDKAKRLFAGLFETLNTQRSQVMTGIERTTRKQKALAGKIRSDALELRTLQDAAEHDQAKVEELTNQVAWSTRVFEDRRKTINYVCEVPGLIERRLFTLARAIQQAME